jgi:RNA polymerase sigma factor (TIGR02999 family)
LESLGGNQNLSAAACRMLPQIYEELRRLARNYLRQERSDHTLQPTALVHEAYIRLAAQHSLDWENRIQVMALAASMMRRVLLDYADRRNAAKRPCSGVRIPLHEAEGQASDDVDLVDLNAALEDLARLDERQARVVEMRFFGGMSIEEIAGATRISTATVERELRTSRLWLMRRLAG